MEQTLISKAIQQGLITFNSLCDSWLSSKGSPFDPDLLEAILLAKPEWLDETVHPSTSYPWFGIISNYVKDVSVVKITFLGLSIAWRDTSAEAIIQKHLTQLKKSNNPVAKISGNNGLTVDIDSTALREILTVLNDNKFNIKTEILTNKFIELGVYIIKTKEQLLEERHWFTPKIMEKLDNIWSKPWFFRELAYPKEIPQCSIGKDREGMFLCFGSNRFNLTADFYSAEKIVIQQRTDKFDPWDGEPFDITSLWPNRQMVIVVNPHDKKVLGFAPIFIIHSKKEASFFTDDYDEFNIFVKEFHEYFEQIITNHNERVSSALASIAQTSLSLCFWLKDYCS